MWTELALGIAASLATFALTFAFVRWDGVALENVGAAPKPHSPVRLLCGFVMGLLLVVAWANLSVAAGYVRWKWQPEVGISPAAIALLAYFALSCREELAFRGYPLRSLERPLGMWGAQSFVAIIFALEHVLGGAAWPQAFFGAGVGAILFGMAALASRGLAIPIGMHAAWNFGQWTLGLKGQPGFWKGVVEPGLEERAEFVAMSAYVIVMALATCVFWLWYRRLTSTSIDERDKSTN